MVRVRAKKLGQVPRTLLLDEDGKVVGFKRGRVYPGDEFEWEGDKLDYDIVEPELPEDHPRKRRPAAYDPPRWVEVIDEAGDPAPSTKKKPGRPKGSKNKPKPAPAVTDPEPPSAAAVKAEVFPEL